ncbi:MAG: serine/threonine protein kinase, partial [Planctomycetota bacterium]
MSGNGARTIGRYETRRVIAAGGMGTVYEAVQDRPHRAVALKVMRRGATSRQAMKRFKHEAEILGRLRHPHIAQVYDAGTFDDGEGAQPYFAMELVKGRPLIEYCDDRSLETRQRLELFARVCDAVQYAHQQGVIHRDLKPDNVLVDDFGEPKVLDFGVARATGSDIQATTVQTDIGQLIGTVPYMSPEQVTGDPTELDTRTDVYSLGIVLYELLSGRLPHDLGDRNIPEVVRLIREEDPTPLSSVNRVFRGDLDTIVNKALAKEKDRRYQTAAELADDVRRYLNDQPIVARPASAMYQLGKFARRNRTLVGSAAGVFVLLVFGAVTSTAAFVQADAQREAALDEAQKTTLVRNFLQEMLASPDPTAGKRELTVAEMLNTVAPEVDRRFEEYPEVSAKLHYTIGQAFTVNGRHKKAETHVVKAQQLAGAVKGLEELELDALGLYIQVLSRQLRFREAIKPARELRNRRRELQGPTHFKSIAAMMKLGDVLGNSGNPANYAEAERLMREGVELTRMTESKDSYRLLERTQAIENFLLRRRRFADAEEFAQWMVQWADEHPNQTFRGARARLELAYITGWLGNYDKGIELAKAAYADIYDFHGSGSTTTRTCAYTLALNL